MRTIKAGAIQQNYMQIPDESNCLSKSYNNNVCNLITTVAEPQLRVTLDLLNKAGKERCDIVTTSEDITMASHYLIDTSESNIFKQYTEASQAIAEEQLSLTAKKYNMYIVGCYMKLIGENVYNVASVFDRNGKIIGEYRKTHLPPNELWQITAGDSIGVINTDFGSIGILICYDMMFPEPSMILSLAGAEIVFHPTAGYGWYDSIGEATLRTRANDGSFYIVTAKNYVYNGAGKSSVIDYWGQTMADAGFYENVIVTHTIDLDIPKTQPEWHYQTHMSNEPCMTKRRLAERRPDIYAALCEQTTARMTAPKPQIQNQLLQKVKDGICHW